MVTTTHLLGTGDPDVLALSRPLVDTPARVDLHLGPIDILQVIYETSLESTQEMLPPGLHPSVPGHVSWQVWSCADSALGPFSVAFNRVGCRLGIKPRCFTTSVIVDNEAVGAQLQNGWGYPVILGSVQLHKGYDRTRGTAAIAGSIVLDIEMRDPIIFQGSAIRYPANLNLARLPRGLRLIQADASYEFERIHRGKAVLHQFDAAALNSGELTPTWSMVATLAKANTTLHEVRYLSVPHLLAVDGTEDIRPKTAAAEKNQT